VYAGIAQAELRTSRSDGFHQRQHLARGARPGAAGERGRLPGLPRASQRSAFDGVPWDAVKAAVPANAHRASVLFIADTTSLTSPDHPVLVVDLLDDGRRPFRCIPPELWAVDNNLNIANMDWADFADAAGESGVFRGFTA